MVSHILALAFVCQINYSDSERSHVRRAAHKTEAPPSLAIPEPIAAPAPAPALAPVSAPAPAPAPAVTTEDVADIKGMLANLNEEVVSLRRLREEVSVLRATMMQEKPEAPPPAKAMPTPQAPPSSAVPPARKRYHTYDDSGRRYTSTDPQYLAEYVGNVNRQLAGAQAAPAAEGGSCYSQSYAVAPSQSYAAEGGSCYSESYAEAPARAYMPRTYAAPPRTYSARTYAASMPVQTIMEAVPTYEMAPQSFSQTSYRTTLLQRMLGRPNVRSFSQSSGSFGSLGAVPMMCGPGGCTPF